MANLAINYEYGSDCITIKKRLIFMGKLFEEIWEWKGNENYCKQSIFSQIAIALPTLPSPETELIDSLLEAEGFYAMRIIERLSEYEREAAKGG